MMSPAIRSAALFSLALLAATGWAQSPGRSKAKGERPQAGKLQPGDDAPNFKLKKLHAEEQIELSTFRGTRPVVLVFGSYT
jgi:hypothetical protein